MEPAVGRGDLAAFAVEFEVEFEPRYQRNNKRTGQKNLRCFPKCSKRGHSNTGFCGRPVTCTVSGLDLRDPNKVILAWAEFTEVNCTGQLRPKQRIPLVQALAKERTREDPIQPWIKGQVSVSQKRQDECTIVFNRELLGWSYSWVSSKHTCDAFHQLNITLFEQKVGSDELVFLGSVTSPRFQLFSRRRQFAYDAPGLAAPAAASSSSSGGPGKRPRAAISKRSESDEVSEEATETAAYKRSGAGAECTPSRAVASANFESMELDAVLEDKLLEMDENRVIDRLLQFVFQFSFAHNAEAEVTGQSSGRSRSASANALVEDFLTIEADMLSQSLGSAIPSASLEGLVPLPPSPSATSLASHASGHSDQSNPVGRIRRLLKGRAGLTDDQVDTFVQHLNKLGETMTIQARNNDAFRRLFHMYSTPQGLRKLKEQVARERDDTHFEWSREREDETFNEECPERNTENSIFAHFRHHMRRMLRISLQATGMNLSDFAQPMELAASHGALMHDPYHPPDVKAAAFLHLQLHGDLSRFEEEDYGSRERKWRDAGQQRRFARDFLIVKRGVFRRQLCNRIVQEHKTKRLLSSVDQPVPAAWDINGSWLNVSKSSDPLATMMNVLGLPMGSFVTKLFDSMFREINIRISNNRLVIKGQDVLMASPEFYVPFTGKPAPLRPPAPVPIMPLSETEKLVSGWLDVDPATGVYSVKFIMGGDLVETGFSKIAELGLSADAQAAEVDPNIGALRERLFAIISNAKSGAKPQLRYVQAMEIVPGQAENESLRLRQYYLFFPDSVSAPDMHDREGLRRFARSLPAANLFFESEQSLVRNYLNQADTEYILELL